MGFQGDMARIALQRFGGSVQGAIEELIKNAGVLVQSLSESPSTSGASSSSKNGQNVTILVICAYTQLPRLSHFANRSSSTRAATAGYVPNFVYDALVCHIYNKYALCLKSSKAYSVEMFVRSTIDRCVLHAVSLYLAYRCHGTSLG